ncbi:MAG: hypothetical protein HFF30_08605 [Flavonifractor sp.]|jgi:hypothetical protein|nr:hypothetical protein [Flavonifractor sp.]
MFRLSEQIAKLEDRWGRKLGRFWERHGKKCKRWFPLALTGWYFYGMLINSIRLGTESTFNTTGEPIGSIWVADPQFSGRLFPYRTGGDGGWSAAGVPHHKKGVCLT